MSNTTKPTDSSSVQIEPGSVTLRSSASAELKAIHQSNQLVLAGARKARREAQELVADLRRQAV